jgi:hypothetical protein
MLTSRFISQNTEGTAHIFRSEVRQITASLWTGWSSGSMTVRMEIVPLSGTSKATEGGRSVSAFVDKLHGCNFSAQLGAGEFAIADVKIPMIIAADDKVRLRN